MLAGGVIVASALAAVLLLLLLSQTTSPQDVQTFLDGRRTEVEEVARQVADILMNYDSTNLDDRRKQMSELATGSFKDEYEDFTSELGGVLEEAAASSRGQLLEDPEVSFSGPAEAVALMRTTQTTQSRENPEGQTLVYILQVTLVDRADEGWKADSVEILSESRR